MKRLLVVAVLVLAGCGQHQTRFDGSSPKAAAESLTRMGDEITDPAEKKKYNATLVVVAGRIHFGSDEQKAKLLSDLNGKTWPEVHSYAIALVTPKPPESAAKP